MTEHGKSQQRNSTERLVHRHGQGCRRTAQTMKHQQHNLKQPVTAVMASAIIVGLLHGQLPAQERSDAHVLSAVFGDQFLSENARTIRHRATQLKPVDRYRLLSEFVLPSNTHPALRLTVDFSELNYQSTTATEAESLAQTRRVQTGGQIKSPLLDLIDVASHLNQLDELQSRIEASPALGVAGEIPRLAGLVVVCCATNRHEVASSYLARLYEIVSADHETREESEGPLLLAIHAGARHLATQAAARDLAYDLHQTHLDLIPPNEWRPFHQHVAVLAHQLVDSINDATEPSVDDDAIQSLSAASFSQWQSGSLFTARSRSTGSPPDIWKRDAKNVHKTSGHSIDLLYFQSPLRGNFDVECDASIFNWRNMHPTYGGHWAGVESDRMHRRIGTLTDLNGHVTPLTSQLTKFRHEIHYRLSIRNDQLTIFGNGRPLHSVTLEPDHDSWLAFRRSVKNSARVWNVRISGEPEIPNELRLSNSAELTGWIAYQGEPVEHAETSDATWRQAGNAAGEGVIAGRYQPDLPRGSYAERLLYYHRPMLEDGSIEYEFFYQDGESVVHPAIDRLAFMLEPGGVTLHWVTDGVFDRSETSPGNTSVEPDNRRGAKVLPLKNNEWNSVRLTVTGDTVNLFLNHQHIYQRPLETTNQRNFGLFHYADQSQAVVRNVVWKGDWPKKLPPISEQELIDKEIQQLDESSLELTATFRHSFMADRFPLGRFAVSAGEMTDTRPGPEGLYVQRHGSGRYQRTVLAAQLAAGGDFDITASFDSLVTRPSDGGHSSLSLSVQLTDEAATEANYRRRHNRFDGREDQHLAYADVASYVKGEVRRSNIGYEPAESESGTLRLVRRGNRLYTLFAEEDSTNFRITGQSEFPEDDIQLGGILLSGLTFGDSFVSFRWKELVVRAERITGPAVDAAVPKELLAELNRKRSALPQTDAYDFAKAAPRAEDLYLWGGDHPWDPKAGGLWFIQPGRETWSASGLAPRKEIAGDFDMTAEFDLRKIVNPKAGVRSTIYLKVQFGAEQQTQASAMFEVSAENFRQVYGRVGTLKPDGGYKYRNVGAIAVDKVVSMRLARYGTTMYFLAQPAGSTSEQVIATAEVSDEPIPGRTVNFMVHSLGEGRETHALLKSLKVRAETFASTDEPPRQSVTPPPRPPAPQKSFFDSVLDFFK